MSINRRGYLLLDPPSFNLLYHTSILIMSEFKDAYIIISFAWIISSRFGIGRVFEYLQNDLYFAQLSEYFNSINCSLWSFIHHVFKLEVSLLLIFQMVNLFLLLLFDLYALKKYDDLGVETQNNWLDINYMQMVFTPSVKPNGF